MAARLLTKDEFLATVEPIDTLRSVSAPTRAWRFASEDDRLVARADGQEFGMSRLGLEAALSKVPGLQKAAVAQWPVDMLLDTINFFYEVGEGDQAAMINEGGSLVGFTKDARPIYPVAQVLAKAEETLTGIGAPMDELGFGNVRVNMDRVTFGLVTERVAEPKVGDVVNGGIWFTHSPTARKTPEISPFVNRLVCTNGMISARALSKWSWRGNLDFLDWVDASVTTSWNALDEEFQGLHNLTEQTLNGHASSVVEDIFDRHRVPAGLRQGILDAVIDEADGTMYGIAQAFNRAANQVEDIGQMRGLLMVTGDLAAQSDRCDSCFRYL